MMKNSKYLIVFILLMQLTGCFKDEPKKVMTRAAGPWTLEKLVQENYDTLGNSVGTKEWEQLGTLFLYHEDDFQYQDPFHLLYTAALQSEVSSQLQGDLFGANRWWMSADGQQFGFGSYDSSTGYVATVGLYTIEKATNKKMELLNVELNPNGTVRLIERWYLNRKK